MSIVHRTLHARYLLTPSGRLNELVLGVLGEAQRRFGVTLYLPVVMSNHLHLLARVRSARRMARFMEFVSSQIAREANRLYGWSGKFWDGPYDYVVVAEDEASLVEKLLYFLAHGCKENLVASPRHWPGIHPAKALFARRHRRGVWVDRTGLYQARKKRRGPRPRAIDYEHERELELSPLPCWAHLSPEAYGARIAELVTEIEVETAARHQREGTRPLGRRAVLAQDPHHRPKQAKKKSRAGWVHASSKAVRRAYEAAYREVVLAYRAASAALRAGDRDAVFPEGTFPPGLPFVPFSAEPRAG